MPKPKLVTFDEIGGVDCYYARINAAYFDISKCTKSRKRKLHPEFLRQMSACIQEISYLTMGVGNLYALTSGGAYVNKPGFHSRGRAYDLGGLFWDRGGSRGTYKLINVEQARCIYQDEILPQDWPMYLGVEAVLRRHFGTVLGMHHNEAHHNHWHIDPGTPVELRVTGFGSPTRVRFLQEALTHVWGLYVDTPDGIWGKMTRAGLSAVRSRLDLAPMIGPKRSEVWRYFLLLTAIRVFNMANNLIP